MRLFDNPPYMRARMKVIGGDTWTFVETGPAVAILPVRKALNGEIQVLLIRERRHSGLTLKMAGGYLRGKGVQEMAHSLLAEEAGVRTSGLYQLYSEMTGFEVVKLPISVLIADNWEVFQQGSAQREVVRLNDAIGEVLIGGVGDQCTTDALMRLHIMFHHFSPSLPGFLK